ncbi:hypothetical protein SAMN04487866_10760 [Thermoactinomyces sp. DSM 45891]|uniref:hypothetical protein n=1 Tax=Thermoactinomyces sp. DSM 45891 TaxID=1761907 RepID=UPI0009115430|nr:hypothetical protein [Thermoactinomyces sp. DSM 45891]SFX42159.1 hypothetical protein SAMN04487866_10760 [Thermoactinomyces sp. DSM 45891]
MKSKRLIAGIIACSAMLTGAEIALPSFTYAHSNTDVSSSQISTTSYTVVSNAITQNCTLDTFNEYFAPFTATHTSRVRIKITTNQIDSDKKSWLSSWGFMRVDDTVEMPDFLVPVMADRNIKNGGAVEFFATVQSGKKYVFSAFNRTGDQLNGVRPTPINATITVDYIQHNPSK